MKYRTLPECLKTKTSSNNKPRRVRQAKLDTHRQGVLMKKSKVIFYLALGCVGLFLIFGMLAVNYNQTYDGHGVYRLFDILAGLSVILGIILLSFSVYYEKKEKATA